MRTNEERIAAMHKRAAELEKENITRQVLFEKMRKKAGITQGELSELLLPSHMHLGIHPPWDHPHTVPSRPAVC